MGVNRTSVVLINAYEYCFLCVGVCACVRVCVRASERASERASVRGLCVRACVLVCIEGNTWVGTVAGMNNDDILTSKLICII